MKTIFRFVVHRWWAVVAAWLMAAAVLLSFAPPFQEVATYDETAFLQEDAGAIQGGRLLAEGWPEDNFSRTAAIVLRRTDGRLSDRDESYARSLVEWFRSDDSPDVFGSITSHLTDPELASTFVSDDGQAAYLLVGLNIPPYTPPANEAIATTRDHLASSDPPPGLEVYVTGTAGVAADENATLETSVNRTHVITLILVVLILLWVYRSPVAPLVPLITIGVAFSVSLSVVSLLAQAGMQVSSLFETFSIVVVFGAGTDYCLFLISRYHEELDEAESAGYRPSRSLRRGTLTATTIVLAGVLASSAMTTFAGFSAQAIAEFGMFRTMGPAMAISILITLITAVTLTPALMKMFGRFLFWPNLALAASHGDRGGGLLIEQQRAHLGIDADLAPDPDETDAISADIPVTEDVDPDPDVDDIDRDPDTTEDRPITVGTGGRPVTEGGGA